ncbi:unnamed protein product [marine sediment metagenome]|uniref:Uncharacterized protein n=1 Tax=marine sediment metagenome TaxID=412755 RepID=X0XBH1_9ZZZZ
MLDKTSMTMTILIGFATKQDIVLTADGRTNLLDATGRQVVGDNLQKIFPSASKPVAICHHGENIIAGKQIGDQISAFLDISTCRSTVEFVKALREHFDHTVRATLAESAYRKGCGFWVAGRAGLTPVIYEIFWGRNVQTGSIEFEEKEFRKCFVLGGDGAGSIAEFKREPIDANYSPNKVKNAKLSYAIKYSDMLYALATARTDVCGGHKHQYLFRQKKWTIEPCRN